MTATDGIVLPCKEPCHEPETLPVQAGFDYGSLPSEVRAEAKRAADEIKSFMHRAVVDVGTALARIKERLPHGQFGKWLSAEFGLTERTAQNYMAAAALVSECETVAVLRPKTLYLLASPSTPSSIRQTVIKRFHAGESIPDSAIKQMIGQAKTQQQEEERRAEQDAREARLSPRTRRSRAQRRAEEELQAQEWERERAEKDDATYQAADLLISILPPDTAAPLLNLLRSCHGYSLADALVERLDRNLQQWRISETGAQATRQAQGAATIAREQAAALVLGSEVPPGKAPEPNSNPATVSIFEGHGEVITADPYQQAVSLFNPEGNKAVPELEPGTPAYSPAEGIAADQATETEPEATLIDAYQRISKLETQARVYWWILSTIRARDPDADAPERDFINNVYRASKASEQQELRAYLAQLKTSPAQELAARRLEAGGGSR